MKVHFIYPDVDTMVFTGVHHGIASISAVLKSNGHQVSLHHITKKISKKEIIEEVKKMAPDLICFSSTTNQYPFVKLCSNWIKEENDIPILSGGIHTTLAPEEVISDKNIDMICIGEGEYPLLELSNNLEEGKSIDDIQNMWIKKGTKMIRNPVRPLISDLDSLPFPDYELFDYERILKITERRVSLMAGRGCPFNCTYCCNHALRKLYAGKGKYVRYRSVDNVLQQIELIAEKYKVRRIYFEDDTFTLSYKWIKEFCAKYSKRFDLKFECNARVETVNRELLKMLKIANCSTIHYGIESGNEWLRKNILKRANMTNAEIIKVFKITRELEIKTFSYNMIGLPFETPEMIEETIELNRLISPDYIVVFIYYPYSGTELWEICKKSGFLTKKHLTSYAKEESILNLPTLTHKEIKKYYAKFSVVALERWVQSDYPSLYYPFKITSFVLGGAKNRKFLTFLKYNNLGRTLFSIFRRGS